MDLICTEPRPHLLGRALSWPGHLRVSTSGFFGLYHSTIMLKSESTWNQKCTECCEPAICLFSKRDISIHNIQRYFWKIQGSGCWHVHFVEFVTILLQTLVIHTDSSTFKLYLIAQIHKSRMYGTWKVLVASVATNFWILVVSKVNLGALATVSGTISCSALRVGEQH